jgi:type I restriction enzyme S subunit
LRLTLPPLSIQRRIAEILGRLDDKIDVNRRINRTLEAMAQALYRHWFVDFGPFRDGEFVESELGAIPKGWEVGRVEDLLELAYGKGLPERARIPGPFPVMGSSGAVGRHVESLVAGPGIVVGRKGTIGKLTWVEEAFWPIDTTYYVVPIRPVVSFEYLHHLLGDLDLKSRNADSAVPGLNRNDAYRLPVVVPPDEVLEGFNRVVKPWFARIQVSQRDIAALAATRDYLLPKLLSGEVEVRAVGAAVHE